MKQGFTYGQITDEEIARVRSRIGTIYHPHFRALYNTAATKDGIRHFCDGLGDDNPLYWDESYAAGTRYGEIIGPPSFLYSVYTIGGGGGFPGVHAFHGGNGWEFFKIIRVNDVFTVTLRYLEVKVKERSEYAGRTALPYMEGLYYNQNGELVARAKGWSVKAERRAGKTRGKYQKQERYKYTAEELKAIEAAYDAEEIRGANPRYWEDVNVGDKLTPVVKGPLNLTDLGAFAAGAFGATTWGRGGAHKFALQYQRKHPAWSYVDPETGVSDTPDRVHASSAMSDEIGIPMAFDYGHQRLSWTMQLITNWMGDDGFLKKSYGEVRRFNMLGDTTWCNGKVTKKYVENNEYLVDIDVWAENQRKEITAPGHATVALPSKNLDWVPGTV